MTRWEELVGILQANEVSERQAATAVTLLLSKGRAAKDHQKTIERLDAAIARWRIEDREKEE